MSALEPARTPPRKLLFVDGMRGLLALIVVVYHITERSDPVQMQALPSGVRMLVEWVRAASGDRVAMFSALSGFCLMLPILSDPNHAIRGGALEFLRRRCQRILPAYYATLALAVVLVSRAYLQGEVTRAQWWEHCAPSKVLSHALLVHNFWEDHIGALVWPVWNLAVEGQLYLLFCFVLVPLWRRCGALARPTLPTVAVLAVAVLVGCLSLCLPAPDGTTARSLRSACPWLALPFATGMVGAAQVVRLRETCGRRPVGWGRAALMVGASIVALRLVGEPPPALTYLLSGVLGTLLLGLCATWSGTGLRTWVLQALETPGLLWLGTCSYSVYLTHALVLPRAGALAHRIVPQAPLPAVWLAELVAAIAFGYLFYRLVEKPCADGGRVRRMAGVPAAADQPAS